jgi:hypothetical protein
MWALSLVSIVAAAILSWKNPPLTTTAYDPLSNFVWVAAWIGFGFVGALIVSSRPHNRIGWALCGITLAVGVAVLSGEYGNVGYIHGLPMNRVAAWLATWTFVSAVGLVGALLLLFPDGRLATRRRRWLARALTAVIALGVVVYAVQPGPVVGDAPPLNPLGIDALGPQLEVASGVVGGAVGVVMMLVLLDMLLRFWRSRGVERQQFRWFALAALAFPVMFFPVILFADEPTEFDPVSLVFFLCGNGLAAAIGIAVTRHGLYEINRVISRTIAYLLLTVVLAALYLGGVTLITTLTSPVVGDSPLAVAAATLAAAAAFGPARRRIQASVDRRFNRHRYNAGQTVDAYRHRLRDEVNMDALSADLLSTVSATVQPAQATLWLRGTK